MVASVGGMEFNTETMRGLMPFTEVLGAELVSVDKDEVVARMTWRAELCTSAGLLHGGALMAFADSVGALCAFLNLPPGTNTSTIESKTNFFRAVREGGSVTSRTVPLHAGRTTVVVQTDLTDDAGKRVAQVTQTQAVLQAQ